jgi:hypothetical protein
LDVVVLLTGEDADCHAPQLGVGIIDDRSQRRQVVRTFGREADHPKTDFLQQVQYGQAPVGRITSVVKVCKEGIDQLRIVVDLETHGLEGSGERLLVGIRVQEHRQPDRQIVASRRGRGFKCPFASPAAWTSVPEYLPECRFSPGRCLGLCLHLAAIL